MRPEEVSATCARFTADKPTTIAIIPAGYADVWISVLPARPVLIRGAVAPVIGSVCMDMLRFDVTGLEVFPERCRDLGSQGDDRHRTSERWRDHRARFHGGRVPAWDRESSGSIRSGIGAFGDWVIW